MQRRLRVEEHIFSRKLNVCIGNEKRKQSEMNVRRLNSKEKRIRTSVKIDFASSARRREQHRQLRKNSKSSLDSSSTTKTRKDSYNELLLLNSANHQLDDEEVNNDQRQAHPHKPLIYTNGQKMKIEAFLLAPKLLLVNLTISLFQPTIQPENRCLVHIHHTQWSVQRQHDVERQDCCQQSAC